LKGKERKGLEKEKKKGGSSKVRVKLEELG
jgi:hypothetical protein